MNAFNPTVACPSKEAETALARVLTSRADQLIDAAAALGGRPAVRRTARLLEDILDAKGRLNRRLRREIVSLHRLLSLEYVQDAESLEAACFAEVDLASPLVEQLCLLTDEFRDHLVALAEAEEDKLLWEEILNAA